MNPNETQKRRLPDILSGLFRVDCGTIGGLRCELADVFKAERGCFVVEWEVLVPADHAKYKQGDDEDDWHGVRHVSSLSNMFDKPTFPKIRQIEDIDFNTSSTLANYLQNIL